MHCKGCLEKETKQKRMKRAEEDNKRKKRKNCICAKNILRRFNKSMLQ